MKEWLKRQTFTPSVSGSGPGKDFCFILELFSSDVYIYQFKAFNYKLQTRSKISKQAPLIYTDLSYPFYAAATKKRKPSPAETITTLLSLIHDSLIHCSFSTNGVFLVWFWNSLQTDKLHDVFISLFKNVFLPTRSVHIANYQKLVYTGFNKTYLTHREQQRNDGQNIYHYTQLYTWLICKFTHSLKNLRNYLTYTLLRFYKLFTRNAFK